MLRLRLAELLAPCCCNSDCRVVPRAPIALARRGTVWCLVSQHGHGGLLSAKGHGGLPLCLGVWCNPCPILLMSLPNH